MKHFLLLFCAIFLAITPAATMAGRGDEAECEDEYDFNLEEMENCASYDKTRVECDIVYSCDSCDPGYTLVKGTALGVEANACAETCNTSTNCKSATTWTAGNTGYQKKTNRSCGSNNKCVETTVYRCAVGYYGSSTNGTSGCTKCPAAGNLIGMSPAGTTVRTGCYIASKLFDSDTTGKFTYTGNSYYCD